MSSVTESPENRARMALAAAFEKSLWPEGEQSFLANHTRTFLSGVIGAELPHPHQSGSSACVRREDLARSLRRIADGFDLLCAADQEPF